MPFKRPSPARSESSSSVEEHPSKRPRLSSPTEIISNASNTRPLKVYIVPAKIDSKTFSSLCRLTERRDAILEKVSPKKDGNGTEVDVCDFDLELSGDVHEADVVVTAVHMKQRLERHVDWELAKSKAIVTPQWLEDSVKYGRPMPCGDYAALNVLHDETVHECPDRPSCNSGSPEPGPSHTSSRSPSTSKQIPEDAPQPADISLLTHTSRYCCCRASPLVCPNQGLIKQLDKIKEARNLEGEERSMLSYARAISVIKAFPHVITHSNLKREISKLPYLGEKLLSMVEEFIKTGQINETQGILTSSRFQALSAFTTIHGIGPHTARKLYNLGLRTLEDLERYYEVEPGRCGQETLAVIEAAGRESDEAIVERSIKVALALRHDFSQTIPRAEVEEMNRVVMSELEQIEQGCKSIVVGGYRRGKPQSNDVDIVISHRNWESGAGKIKGLCKRFVRRLHERGLVTHVMHLSGFHEHNALRTHHWDSLEKALTVFVLPGDGSQRRVYRRLDLIFAAPQVFWTAVVGWTGSTMFQRDLRLYAKQQK
ncbi:hypothetical protein SERLADRAFT_447668 [Serpula lacrymans var. lacrymans S7.9]|uniref:DNA-directed DNA polymerase X domain-containing protein n=1 Tax=Serpula lacrymans var. lacrymans (strain S7.9) TaxID=578457 RepID=F8NSL8_SERL9|nr:uncharacterized protein SERLADRAFT_447668 [Serpula lacrymans var. lacrymans S7.9]EGO26473.1 hypothetical protein SERLADRAFT_447668 [Serpula lacrymans var. lacrymans S7.9]